MAGGLLFGVASRFMSFLGRFRVLLLYIFSKLLRRPVFLKKHAGKTIGLKKASSGAGRFE